MAEDFQAQLVSPVQVFQHDEQGTASASGHQQVGHILHQQAATVMRVAHG